MGGDEGILDARESPEPSPPTSPSSFEGFGGGLSRVGFTSLEGNCDTLAMLGPQTWFLYPGLW